MSNFNVDSAVVRDSPRIAAGVSAARARAVPVETEPSRLLVSTRQWFSVLLVAGVVFLGTLNFGCLGHFLPDVAFDPKQHLGSIVAVVMIVTATAGIGWGKFRSFLRRWSRNREPITFDAFLMGITAGLVCTVAANLLSHRAQGSLPSSSVQLISLLAGAFLAFSAYRWRRLSRNRSQPRIVGAAEQPIPTDEPLDDLTPETDAFGRGAFLDACVSTIHRSDPETCHVLGVVGPWGSGKTTLVRALMKRVQAPFRVIQIDSWAFRETGRLTEAILTAIVQDIDKRYLFPDLRRALAQYLAVISPAAKAVPALESLSMALADCDGLDRLRQRLDKAVRSTQERYFVVIDDVDRLDHAELHSLLKTVRLCASIPRVVYALVYDRESLYRILVPTDSTAARDFIEKIVEDEWELPLIPADKLRSYLTTHLPAPVPGRHERFVRDFEQRLKECFPAIRLLLNTPRHIKRVGIALRRRSLLVSRLNSFDAFVWEVLRQRQPVLYQFVTKRPWLVLPERDPAVDPVMRIFMDKAMRESAEKEIEDLIARDQMTAQSTRELFWNLFPKRGNYTERARGDWLRLRRICHETFFDAYFLLDCGPDISGPEQMDALIEQINRAERPEVGYEKAMRSIEAAIQAGSLEEWISLLAVFSDDINSERVRRVIDAIRDSANLIRESATSNAGMLLHRLASLNVTLVGRLPSDKDATSAVADLLTKTSVLPMASIYARYLSGEWGRYGHRSPDVKHCSALFDKRLEKELMNLGHRVFDQPPSHMAVLMFAHSKPDAVYEFLETVAGSNAHHWAKIILNVMSLWQEGGVEINQEVIHRVPPKTLAKAHGFLNGADMTGWSEYESRAAEGFIAQWSPPGNPD